MEILRSTSQNQTKDIVPVSINDLKSGEVKKIGAIVDCLARLIPQEGVDYNLKLTLEDGGNIKLNITPLTDKGVFWRDYVSKMIHKYPPNANYVGYQIPKE